MTYKDEAQAKKWALGFRVTSAGAFGVAIVSLIVSAIIKRPGLEIFWPGLLVSVMASYEYQGARDWLARRKAAGEGRPA